MCAIFRTWDCVIYRCFEWLQCLCLCLCLLNRYPLQKSSSNGIFIPNRFCLICFLFNLLKTRGDRHSSIRPLFFRIGIPFNFYLFHVNCISCAHVYVGNSNSNLPPIKVVIHSLLFTETLQIKVIDSKIAKS